MVEAAICLAAEMFAEEMLVDYAYSFWPEVIADDLVTAFEVYVASGPEPPLNAHHVIVDASWSLCLPRYMN